MSKDINDQIVEYQQSQQEAAEALSQAQSRVAEPSPDRRYNGLTARLAGAGGEQQRRGRAGRRPRIRGRRGVGGS